MDNLATCDFCCRSEKELQRQTQGSTLRFEIDEDGLWICGDCKANIIGVPLGYGDDVEDDERIRELIGKSAGAICYSMNLPYNHPYKSIIDAASKIAYDEDRYMSAWSFVTQWGDGTTVWQSSDKNTKALVFTNGKVELRQYP